MFILYRCLAALRICQWIDRKLRPKGGAAIADGDESCLPMIVTHLGRKGVDVNQTFPIDDDAHVLTMIAKGLRDRHRSHSGYITKLSLQLRDIFSRR